MTTPVRIRFRPGLLAVALCAGPLVMSLGAARAFADNDFLLAAESEAGPADEAPALEGERGGPFHVWAGATAGWGPISGYLQTPAGGKVGTTSSRRPTLDELGIDDAVAKGPFTISARWGNHEVYGGVDLLDLSGRATLTRALTTQGVTFAAGTRVRSTISLGLYRIGYRYRIAVGQGKARPFELYPTVEGAMLDFDYMLTGGAVTTRRAYRVDAARAGLGAKWPVTGDLTLSGEVLGPIPLNNTVDIWTGKVTLDYVLWRGGGVAVIGNAGVACQLMDYQDRQTQPNHLHVEYGPIVIVGLRIES